MFDDINGTMEPSTEKFVQVVMTAPGVPEAYAAIKEARALGWKLMGFDMMLPKPVIVFNRPREAK